MLALRWHGRRDVRLEEVETPEAAPPGGLLLGVEWCGICGTDREEYESGPHNIPVGRPHPLTGRTAPVVLGHEVAGQVIEVGERVEGFEAGQVVGVEGTVSCGACPSCRHGLSNLCPKRANVGFAYDGGLAERMVVPASACLALPPGLDPLGGALAEPLSVAVRALRRSGAALGESAVVVGAGTIGLFVLQLLALSGLRRVVVLEPAPTARELAASLGAAEVRPGWDVGLEEPPPSPVSFECSGTTAGLAAALEATAAGGRVVLVGVPKGSLDVWTKLVHRELTLVSSLSHLREDDYLTDLGLLEHEAVRYEELVAARLALRDASKVFASPCSPPPVAPEVRGTKIVVTPETSRA